MLTKDEQNFLTWWENNREKERKFLHQLAYGSPWGLIFALPVLLAVIFHDWYKNMIPITTGQLVVISIAVLGIAFFYALFRMRFKWDQNEQLYQELKFKEKKDGAAIV